jgi:hypothetical protein
LLSDFDFGVQPISAYIAFGIFVIYWIGGLGKMICLSLIGSSGKAENRVGF